MRVLRWMGVMAGMLVCGVGFAQSDPVGLMDASTPLSMAAACPADQAQPPVASSGPSLVPLLRAQVQALLSRNFVPQQILPTTGTLKRNDQGPEVAQLDAALIERDELSPSPEGPRTFFDSTIEDAVKDTQRKFGLVDDGQAGPIFSQNMNQSDATLARALAAWADEIVRQEDQAIQDQARYLVLVNVPSFTLHLIDTTTGKQVLESRVVVGKATRKTPLFTTHIINLKFNPDWTPPPSLVRTGHSYVRPGPNNPLGLLRFSTDNHLNIYLHDTNEHKLFANSNRARSSGCIRVQQWHQLASWLSNESGCSIDDTLSSGKTIYQKIDKTPVVLTYSRVDYVEGGIGVHPDVYGQGAAAIGAIELDGGSSQDTNILSDGSTVLSSKTVTDGM